MMQQTNKEMVAGKKNWVNDLTEVFKAYPVNFYLVGESTLMYDEWLNCGNVRTLTYREWISYCDISQ